MRLNDKGKKVCASLAVLAFLSSTPALILVVLLSAYGIIFSSGSGGADSLGLAGRGGAMLFLILLGSPLLVVSLISGLCVKHFWTTVQPMGRAGLRACAIAKQAHRDIWAVHPVAGIIADGVLICLVMLATWGIIEFM